MLDEKKEMCKVSGITVKSCILSGHPAEKIILELAQREKVDLIVMGITGLKGLSKIKALGMLQEEYQKRLRVQFCSYIRYPN
jgi:hypothetical protein